VKVRNKGFELAVEGLVESGEAAVSGEDAVVEGVAVHNGFGFDLVGELKALLFHRPLPE